MVRKDIDPITDELITVYRKIKEIDPDFESIKFVEGLKPSISRLQKIDLCNVGAGMLLADSSGYPCAHCYTL